MIKHLFYRAHPYSPRQLEKWSYETGGLVTDMHCQLTQHARNGALGPEFCLTRIDDLVEYTRSIT